MEIVKEFEEVIKDLENSKPAKKILFSEHKGTIAARLVLASKLENVIPILESIDEEVQYQNR